MRIYQQHIAMKFAVNLEPSRTRNRSLNLGMLKNELEWFIVPTIIVYILRKQSSETWDENGQ